jgi:sugar/nucleoside kinase (ribokinase family)
MKGVLCSGNVVADLLVHPVDQLTWGATTWVDTIGHSMGGNGANTSYALARLGIPVRLASVVGDDDYGDEMLAGLRSVGVDTSAITRAWGPSATTISLVRSDGNRLLLHKPGVNLHAMPEPVEFSPWMLQGVSHYHLANPFCLPAFRSHAAETLRRAKAAGLQTSMDAAWDSKGRWIEDIGPGLAHVDVLFANEGESHMLTGQTDPVGAARALRQAGASVVVVKLGPKGCVVVSEEGDFSSPAFKVEVTDTTGAGDCFVGGFLAARQRGLSLREAAAVANAVGALSARRVGSVAGVLSWEETEEWMAMNQQSV